MVWSAHDAGMCAIGGAVLGVASAVRMVLWGKVTGSSGLLSKTLKPANIPLNERAYAGVFTLGLVIAGVVGSKYYSDAFETWEDIPMANLSIAGILVGFGSQLGNGCTSGHGICGISSFRIRSLVATCTFMATGVITAIVLDTQQYLPHFENLLSAEEGGILAAIAIAACLLLVPAGYFLPKHNNCQTAFRLVSEFVTGFAFAAGLIVSNMTRCSATISFLDLRYWNPALAFVMAAAIAITAAVYQYMFNQGKPLLGDEFQLSKLSTIDAKLVTGAAIFGIGWGMMGACPAPAITNILASQNRPENYIYFFCLWAGVYLFEIMDHFIKIREKDAPKAEPTVNDLAEFESADAQKIAAAEA